jgi:uncharacterized phage protein (TIGR02220 family)
MTNIIIETIDYLNSVANTNYSPDFQSTKDALNNLINIGYGYNDFVCVIDKKWSDWKGTEFEKYIRPETLFGKKFENYLNEQPRIAKSGFGKLASAVNQAKRTTWKLDNK